MTVKKGKKGEKLFGILIKLLGKKAHKDALLESLSDALDTNRDGKVDLSDFMEGNWKKINWIKFVFALVVLAGSIFYGVVQFAELF